MGMDGLSIANTGVVKEATSAELANRTEQAVNADPTNSAKQVQGSTAKQRVKEKEDDEGSGRQKGGRSGSNGSQDEVFEDGFVQSEPENSSISEIEIEDIENPNKEFYVKLNIKDDIIELYDSETDRLVETIPGAELSDLVKKLNMASGIFVNKKV